MKILNKFLIILSVSLAVTSCDFGETNIDPTAVSEGQVTLPLMLPKAQVQSVYNLGATSGRYGGIFMQYFRGVEAQQAAITNYNVNESDVNNTWEFQLYVGSMRDCITILEKATAEGTEAPHYAGIARVLLAQNLGFATQLWGSIPYSDAFQGSDNLKPAFDTQEEIFASIQSLLDEAITEFQGPSNGREPGDDDLIHGGDMSRWIATARSLKARYHLMLSKRNGNAAYTAALADIDAGAIESVDAQPDFFFGTAANEANPIALFEADRSGTLSVDPDFAEVIMGGDPRASEYFYFDSSLEIYRFADNSLYWGAYSSPIPLISYAETKFIEAEALLMTGDAPGAQAALEEAILANMEQVGLDPTSSTVTSYATNNSDLTILSGTPAQLNKIILEKYKAMYVQGMVEIWTDYRRTGYPNAITPEPGASISIIPRRLPYPQSERLTNTENLNTAVSAQGGATIEDDLWAFN